MATFGKDMLVKEFELDPEISFLNQGAYGNAPKKVLDHRLALIKEMDSVPDEFYRERTNQLWEQNVTAAANFVRADPQNVVLVNNTLTGINAVLRSFNFQRGDAILINTWTFVAVRNTCRYLAEKLGLEVLTVDITLPLQSIQQLFDAYEDRLKQHDNIKIVILDHITGFPATLMPVAGLAALCRKYDKVSLVDGAHAPGQIDLNIEDLHVDFYVGNFYKWAFVPRGCAFLWIHSIHHNEIYPVVISTGYSTTNMQTNFRFQGTADMSHYYSASAGFDFIREIGGYAAIDEYCRDLANRAAERLAQRWDTVQIDIPDSMRAPFMRNIRVPVSGLTAGNLQNLLWSSFNILTRIFNSSGVMYCRICVSVYCEMDDYDKLADAVLSLISDQNKGKLEL